MQVLFNQILKNKFSFLKGKKSLLAISGGLDSVVLTHLCRKPDLNLDIALVHCNFNLRGAESDADEAFVRKLAADLNLEVFVQNLDTETFAKDRKISIQMAARALRYNWFEELRESNNFDYILTAHHVNDDLETFIINFIRGTGLEGLTGIPEQNEHIVRPLLSFSRATIETYAVENKISWREDSSNASTKYLRNSIRHEVVPLLEKLNPKLLDGFQKTQVHLTQSAALVEDYISVVFSRVAKKTEFGYAFNIKALKTIPHTQAVLFQLFRSFGFTEWDDVFHLLNAQPGKIVVSKTHRLIKDREELLLTSFPAEDKIIYEIPEGEEVVMLPAGTFHFETIPRISGENRFCSFVDKAKLNFPLHLRKRQKGDVFYPSGMRGKKKLSKFFKDKKLSLPEKENCWLLCSGDEIVWVVGHRADKRFEVTNKTTEILKITYTL